MATHKGDRATLVNQDGVGLSYSSNSPAVPQYVNNRRFDETDTNLQNGVKSIEKNGYKQHPVENDSSSVTVTDKTKEETLKLSDMPRKKLYTLLLIAMGNFLFGTEFYFIAPFYPIIAKDKGLSATSLGFIFSMIHLTIFLSSPIYGNFMEKIGIRFIYVTGILTGGFVTVINGFVDRCEDGVQFLVLSLVCRFIVGLSASAFMTASLAILTDAFPKNISRVFGLSEVANGIGFMAAPAIGGAFYQLGGFGLPFWVVGCTVIINGILLWILLPIPQGMAAKRRGNIFTLTRSSLIRMVMANILVAAISISFVEPVLSIYLEVFDLSAGLVGLIFVIMPGVYGLTSILTGYIADTKDWHLIQFCAGNVTFFVGYMLIGPSPILVGVPLRLWLVIVSLMPMGFGYGSVVIPSLKCMLKGAIEIGFADNLDTYGMVSGLFFTTLFCGGSLGTILAGVLVEHIGFPWGCTVVAFTAVFMNVVTIIYFKVRQRQNKI